MLLHAQLALAAAFWSRRESLSSLPAKFWNEWLENGEEHSSPHINFLERVWGSHVSFLNGLDFTSLGLYFLLMEFDLNKVSCPKFRAISCLKKIRSRIIRLLILPKSYYTTLVTEGLNSPPWGAIKTF